MTNSNQKERLLTKIAMLEQNNQVLQNKCEEYLGKLADTKTKLDIVVDALFDIHKHSYACCAPASKIGYIHAVSYNALDKTVDGWFVRFNNGI